MTNRISTQARGLLAIALTKLTIPLLLALGALPALAVHNIAVELDGDIATNKGLVDWATLYNGQPSNFSDFSFVTDPNTATGSPEPGPDPSTFTNGAADTSLISKWGCAIANNVTDKGDIMHAYAVRYINPSNGHQILYFAFERNANQGDANVGFWFLQDGKVGCQAPGKFTGAHVNGDVLLVAAFTNGGTTATINAYTWNNGLPTVPDATGGNCLAANNPSNDILCAVTNTAPISGSTIPWDSDILTKITGSNTPGITSSDLDKQEFVEGGLDLTALFERINRPIPCFPQFITETRASQSTTAALYDYTLGRFEKCEVKFTVEKTCLGACIAQLAPGQFEVDVSVSVNVCNQSSGPNGGLVVDSITDNPPVTNFTTSSPSPIPSGSCGLFRGSYASGDLLQSYNDTATVTAHLVDDPSLTATVSDSSNVGCDICPATGVLSLCP